MDSRNSSEQEVARLWDEGADLLAANVRAGLDLYREHFNNPAFLAFLGDVSGKDVLDAGCGEGYNTRLLARRGARVTGVDISQRMIELAREEEQREPLGIRYEVASFCDLSFFHDASFDAVVSFMALMDGPDYHTAAKEFFRVLRPGGDLVFSITHPCFRTKGYGWVRDEHGDCVSLTVSHYFAEEPYLTHFPVPKEDAPEARIDIPLLQFQRTISDYVNILISAGFVLKRIEEPRPSEEACERHPFLRRWREHAASFLYVRAVKPSS